jgi:hypothetical protein
LNIPILILWLGDGIVFSCVAIGVIMIAPKELVAAIKPPLNNETLFCLCSAAPAKKATLKVRVLFFLSSVSSFAQGLNH